METIEANGGVAPLRNDLEIHHVRGDTFLLLDPKSRSGFELGPRERYLLELLRERRDRESIAEAYRERFGAVLTVRHFREFLYQLDEHGLLALSENGVESEPVREEGPAPAPLSREDEGAGLNSFLDALVLLFGFVLHPVMVVPIAGLAVVAFVGAVKYWELAVLQWTYLYHALDVPLVLVVLLMLVVFLEIPKSLLYGMACRRFGGRVRFLGFRLLHGLVPVFLCDAGDSAWLLPRRGKLTLLTAGLFCQFAIASVASLAWIGAERFSTLSHAFLLLAVPSLFGLLFHLNLLMPLTASQLLAFWLDRPRLWHRARAEARAWLTLSPSPEPMPPRKRFWFRAYGLGTYLWNLLLAAAIIGFGTWLLTSRFGRWGALLSAAFVLRWFQSDIGKLLMSLEAFRWLIRAGGKWYVRWPLRILIVLALVFIAFLPHAHEIAGEGRVVPEYRHGIRALVTAELVAIHVDEGDLVGAGDPIATMTDRDVGADVATTIAQLDEAIAEHELLLNGLLPEEIAVLERDVDRYQIEVEYQKAEVARMERLIKDGIRSQTELDQQKRLRDSAQQRLEGARQTLARGRIGARSEQIAAAQAKIERLRAQLKFHEQQAGLLQVRTPVAGRVSTPFVRERLGQVAQEGELICVVESTDLVVEIGADEAAAARVLEGMDAEVRLWGLDGVPLHGKVIRVAQAVYDERDVQDYAVRSDRELLLRRPDPGFGRDTHVRVYVKPDSAVAGLVPGLTGYGRIKVGEEELWRGVSRPFVRFFRTEVWSWLP